jgi:uncharacterized membrane protein YkvA (DUF1232 family)
MPWYRWLLFGLGVFIALAAISFRVLRATLRGRHFLSLSTRARLEFGRALLADPGVPLVAKLSLFVMVGYLALPFDLIPDFLPVIGQIDDDGIVLVTLAALVFLVPRERFEAALTRAETGDDRRRAQRAQLAEQ